MKTGLDTLLDVMLLLMMLAVGLPVLLFCFNVFLNEQDYGFGTFSEKSVQQREGNTQSYWGNSIESKVIWTDAHRALMPLVDDAVDPNSALDKVYQIVAAYNNAVSTMSGLTADWDAKRYHLRWGLNGRINTAVFNNRSWVRPVGSPALPEGTGFYTSADVANGIGWKGVDD